MGKGKNNPKAQRANSKNPNNPAFKASMDNKSNQMNPNNPVSSSKGEEKDKEKENK